MYALIIAAVSYQPITRMDRTVIAPKIKTVCVVGGTRYCRWCPLSNAVRRDLAGQTLETLDLSVSEIRDSITLDGTGHLTAAGELAVMREENHAWAMVFDDTGTVIFQSRLPSF